MPGIHLRDARGPQGVRLYAIGDVHGRLDLLSAMHRAVAEEIERDRPADWRVVHLGDYVDRGPDSRGVIEFLGAAGERDARYLFLCGNHEAGLLDFLNIPDPNGLFMRFGGVQTAHSYGVDITAGPVGQAAAALAAAIPARHTAFLRGLGVSAEFGDFFFCHAGIRPGIPLGLQARADLTWIRDAFLDHAGLHPKVVVHGHTPQPEPELLPNRVNVDTRAYASGRLTALVVDGADKRILTVREGGSVQRREAVTP
jgi:serine/threonine protein phosphatase 1